MQLALFSLRDVKADLFEHQIWEFVDEKVGISTIRRSLRNEYLNGSMNTDWFKEHEFVHLGYFDTETGYLDNCSLDLYKYPCIEFINDLIVKES